MRSADDQPIISLLTTELWADAIYVHLVVLAVGPWPDRTLDYLAHGVDRCAFPDADAEVAIVGECIDRQREVGRKPSFDRFGLGGKTPTESQQTRIIDAHRLRGCVLFLPALTRADAR